MFNSQLQQDSQSGQHARPSKTKQFYDQGEAQLKTPRDTVRVYFIGWKLLGEDGSSPIIMAKQKAFTMPPIGGYLDIDDVYFKDLSGRMQMYNPTNGTWVQSLTTDPTLANAVKNAFDAGTLGDDMESFAKIVQSSALLDMSDDELAQELERRKEIATATAELEAVAEAPAVESEKEVKPQKARIGRPPKNATK